MRTKSGALLLLGTTIVLSACGANKENNTASPSAASPQSSSTASATASATAAASDTPASSAKDPVTLKLMTYTASGQEQTLKAMIDAFQAANADVKVDYEVVPYADYTTKLNTLLASGSAPDLFEVGYENFLTYAAKDQLLDLTPSIAADSSFKPDVYKKLAYDAFNYNGKQMGVTESFSDVVLFYNKDLFDAKGLAYPDASWTWKEELEAAQKLTDAKKGIWGTYAPIQFYEFYKTIAQNGGGVWSADGKPTLNSPANVEALQWMIDKASKYKVSPPLNDDTFNQPDADLNAFVNGKLAMARFGIWNFAKFSEAKFNWDIALEPGNTQKAHHFFADGLVAAKTTKNADAAWRFLKFFTSAPEAVSKRIEAGWSIPAVTDPAVLDAYYKQKPPESKQVVTDALDSLVLPPVGPKPEKWGEFTAAVGEELDKAKLGRSSAQEALDAAQKKVEALVK
ncbi:multiple sugar transport system substrate-binding protein [Cohnella sp. OV330]|uniref:ABC transporter substrate-binding protein n=1 Tax=Cohnella sp. OV330 TaxID=1855288 RepID=UPI0008F29C4C|nr:sugar ABC transporter substrate-binding protein [Cohnella sp. OV330]SFB28696.1 multiple sugar transport system substrate-binding protein [Cohnella sp. OV330]